MATGKAKTLRFDLDDEDLKVFSEEADEQLEILDTALVQLEGEPDPDLVQQIFRAAHTLKGASATIGHKKMAGLTHAMETVLDEVRNGRRHPSSEMVDVLLASLDALRVLAQEVVTKIDSGIDTSGLEADLHAILAAEPVSVEEETLVVAEAREIPGAALEAIRQDSGLGKAIFEVTITIDEACQLPSIRSFQVLQELDSVSVVHVTWPDRASVESGAGDSSLVAVITTPSDEEHVRAAVAGIADVGGVEIAERTVEDLETPLAPTARKPAAGGQPKLSVVEGAGAGADAAKGAGAARKAAQSVRIDVERLDGLMNLVGELVIDRTRLQQIREQLSSVLKGTGLKELEENFEETAAHLARVTDELQEEIMRSRMLPVRSVLSRLPRMVRDIASKCGKKVELFTAGEETELDRSVIEEISDPLVHILRNAVDHGVETPEERKAAGKPETGAISVTAWNQEASIYLAIRDDGRGIDAEALRRKAIEKGLVQRDIAEAASDEAVLQYIFIPGLSTAKSLSDVSGRGVGMDIVRTNIERLNGQVTLKSTRGVGTEFLIRLPLTLATTKALMVTARGTVYAMPLVSVTEALDGSDADIATAAGQATLRLRDRLLPVSDLAHALGDRREPPEGPRYVVAARHGDRQVAFVVDRLLGEQDVVVKSLGSLIGSRKGLSGATILGDGTLGLIIDIASLVSDQASLAASA